MAEVFDRFPEAVFKVDFRLPAKHFPCERNVWFALCRIILGEEIEDDFRWAFCHSNDGFRQVDNAEFDGISQIDWS